MKAAILKPLRRLWGGRAKMSLTARRRLSREVVEKSLSLGVALAGIADVPALRTSLSHRSCAVRWPVDACSAVVLAWAHPSSDPLLDRWDGGSGRTPGNRCLIRTGASLVRWLKRRHGIGALQMPYQIGHGGIFVKDAAVLAGLGVIGRHNLVVTPRFGSRIRLRAILLNTWLAPTGPVSNFAPCDPCPAPCRDACPQGAFDGGDYDHRRCLRQMLRDEDAPVPDESGGIQYCRACELACLVGQ